MKVNPDSCRNKQTDTTYQDRFNSIQTEASLIKQRSYIRQGRYIQTDTGTARLNRVNKNWCRQYTSRYRYMPIDAGISRQMPVHQDWSQYIQTVAGIYSTDSIQTDTDIQTDSVITRQMKVSPFRSRYIQLRYIQTDAGICRQILLYTYRCRHIRTDADISRQMLV